MSSDIDKAHDIYKTALMALVIVEKDEPGLWAATFLGYESRLVAMGRTRAEAVQCALDMFVSGVDRNLADWAALDDPVVMALHEAQFAEVGAT